MSENKTMLATTRATDETTRSIHDDYTATLHNLATACYELSKENEQNSIVKCDVDLDFETNKSVPIFFSEDIFYKKVKEKLIGLTIYYQPNLSDVFVAIIDKYIMI